MKTSGSSVLWLVSFGSWAGFVLGSITAIVDAPPFPSAASFALLALWILAGCLVGASLALLVAIARGLARVYSDADSRARALLGPIFTAILISAAATPVIAEVAQRPLVLRTVAREAATVLGYLAIFGAALPAMWLLLRVRRPLVLRILLILAGGLLPVVAGRIPGLGPLPDLRLALVAVALTSMTLGLLARHPEVWRGARGGALIFGFLGLIFVFGSLGVLRSSAWSLDEVEPDSLSAALARWAPTESAAEGSSRRRAADVSRWFGRSPSGHAEDLERLLPERRDFNLLWITVCTFRRDRLGCYGNTRGLTPSLDRLAETSQVFDFAYTTFPASAFAMDSMFTGRYPFQTSRYRRKAGLPPVEGEPWFPDHAAGLGRSTWGLTAMNVLMLQGDFAGLLAGFEVQNPYPHIVGATAPEIADAFIELLGGREGNQPFFAWTMLMDPHAPYEGDAEGPPLGTGEQDLYDGDVRITDRAIGRMLDALRDRGLAASTVVVVHGDHGEEFGEHGGRWHYTSVYDEQVRVPLILHVPGLGPARHSAPVDLSDLAPTLCEVLGDDEPWPGSGDSLVPLLLGERMESFAFSEVLYPGRPAAVRRAVISPTGYKLICRGVRPHMELYDLEADPAESHDLGEAAPLCTRLTEILGGILATEPDWQAAFPELPQGPIPSPPAGHRSDRDLLREVLRQESISDDHLRLAIAAVRQLGDREAALLAARHLDHPDPEMRRSLLGLVAAFRVKEALGDVVTLVEDADAGVRLLAIRAVGVLGNAEARAVLSDRPERSTEERIELGLARAELGDLDGLDTLLPLLDPERPLEAARVLAKLDDREVLRACLLVAETPRDLQLGALLVLLGSGDSVAWDFVSRAAEERTLPASLLVEALKTPFPRSYLRPLQRPHPPQGFLRTVLTALTHPHPALRHAALQEASELWSTERLGELSAAWLVLSSSRRASGWSLPSPAQRDAARALLREAEAEPDAPNPPAPPTTELQIWFRELSLPSLAPRFPVMLRGRARGDPGTGAEIVAEYLPSRSPSALAGAATITFDERGTTDLKIALAPRKEAATGLRLGRRLESGEIKWLPEVHPLR